MSSSLQRLAGLLKERNRIEQEISELIGRPAHPGHVGEYVAAEIFGVDLNESASQKGTDGIFRSGPLQGKSVNIKSKSRNDGLMDVNPDGVPDYFLVLSGPWTAAESSREKRAPWTVALMHLFDARRLVNQLRERKVKIGLATSVVRWLWEEAEVFPGARNPLLALTPMQREKLRLFAAFGNRCEIPVD